MKIKKLILTSLAVFTGTLFILFLASLFFAKYKLTFQSPVQLRPLILIEEQQTLNPFVSEVEAQEALGRAEAEPQPALSMDVLITKLVEKYAGKKSASFLTYQLHCLAHFESGHYTNKNCGDSGKACGPFQFHEPTYQAFRKQMMKEGWVDHIGSRLDIEDAVETTAWAMVNGKELHWGPILRGKCQ